MKNIVFIALVVVSLAVTAEARKKSSSKQQPSYPRQTTEPCAAYGCEDDGYSSDDDQSSNETYVPGSETYEGNDRDTGSDYINGMPY